ncbi:MAG: LptF/LptG family permease [Phycisphaerales bacterium]|nr:MAG: LptF/LptG family permease [Phycisphaerales bacterium]
MPWLLYRYILGELLRTFLLTAAILVVVIAFGITLRSFAGEGVFSAVDVARFLVMATVPMMQFALPFSAGFASTMVLYRLTSDNEIMAAAVSGVSYQRLLAPVFALGVVLTLIMVVLTQWMIPKFWDVMERTVAADATRIFQASIDRGAPFRLGNIQIYADHMRVIVQPGDTTADTRMRLSRVVAVELDREGRVEKDITARDAVVDIYREGGDTFIKLLMNDTVIFDGSSGQLARMPEVEPPQAIVVPSVLHDELRAKTRSELLAIRDQPDLYGRVVDDRLLLAHAISEHQAWRQLDRQLREDGRIELVQSGPSRRRYVIYADSISAGRLERAENRTIEIRQFEDDTSLRRINADGATITRLAGSALAGSTYDLELRNAEVIDLQADGLVNRRERLTDQNLLVRSIDEIDWTLFPAEELIVEANRLIEEMNAPLGRQVQRLERRIEDLRYEIDARIMARYAQAATAFMLLTIGAVLAMWLRGSVPLVIYVWAFAPAVLGLILISGGDKMMRDGDVISGLGVMWSGNLILGFLLCIIFWKLSRH